MSAATIRVGETVAHYRIVDKLGEGGMGVVYKARDLNLDRFVAIKVLASDQMDDEEHRLRFLQEARAASALNHPGIVTVHGIDRTDGSFFIVMEYVDGSTLHQLIHHRALSLFEALQYAVQIAAALSAAHAAGVIHRDVKPGNIMVSASGQAKVLDFGLAKLVHREGERDEVSTLTVTPAAAVKTEKNVIIGTVAYMSPEQAQGRKLDGRSDIFSFGSVLYEMVTGRRPFGGQNRISTLAAIMERDPDPPRSLAPGLPPELERIISRCLRKEPTRRFQHMDDVMVALDEVKAELESGTSGSQRLPLRPRRRKRAWLAGAALAIFAALWAGYPRWKEIRPHFGPGPLAPAAAPHLRLVIATEGEILDPHLSPDGTMIAYAAGEQEGTRIFVQRVSGGARLRLTDGPGRDDSPEFAPDGEHIAFTHYGLEHAPQICVVPALGGDVVCPLAAANYAAWSPDGHDLAIVAVPPNEPEALAVCASDGSEMRVLLRADAGLPFLRAPSWSPRGSEIAVTRSSGGIAGEIWLIAAATGAARRVVTDPPGVFSKSPAFSLDGTTLIHESNRAGATNLWAARVSDGALTRLTTGAGPDERPSLARNGTMAFVSTRSRVALFLHELATSQQRQLTSTADVLWSPAFSPDGHDIAFSRGEIDGSWHIWIVSTSGGNPRRLTSGALPEIYPRFSPDGAWCLFNTWSPGPDRVWRVDRRGGPAQPLTPVRGDDDQYADPSPDGRWLAFARSENGATSIWVSRSDGSGARLRIPPEATVPCWSRDGRWIAFSRSRRAGSAGIYVSRADGTGVRRLSETGSWPVWWPNGARLGYLDLAADGTEQIFTVPTEGGKPAMLHGVHLHTTNNKFDISPNGRFLALVDTVSVSSEVWLMDPQSRASGSTDRGIR